MTLLTGMTEDGTEVPVQVKPDGRLVAEGLPGPAGGVGPAGPAGPQGPQGVKGDTGTTVLPPPLYVSDGKVGIGAQSPSELLHLASSASPAIRIRNDAFGTGAFSQLQLDTANSYNNGSAVLKGVSENAGNNSVSFVVETSEATGMPVEKFRITSDGKIGIGTSSPGSKLHVSGTAASVWVADGTNTVAIGDWDGSTNYIKSLNLNIQFTPLTHQAAAHIFRGPSSEYARIDSSGRLLVGAATAVAGSAANLQASTTANLGAVAVYADNAAAVAGGLAVGDVYRTATGQLMIAF